MFLAALTPERSHPDLLISQTQEIWIRKGKRVNPGVKHKKPKGDIFSESLNLCTITPSSVFLARDLFKSSGGFDEKMSACEDYDLWLRISAQHKVGLIEEYLLTKYGGHKDQLSQHYTAMDRFRIYSLGKLFLSGILTSTQSNLAFEVLRIKTGILLSGIRKRNPDNRELIEFVESLFELNQTQEEFIQTSVEFLLSDTHFN